MAAHADLIFQPNKDTKGTWTEVLKKKKIIYDRTNSAERFQDSYSGVC